MAVSFAQRLQRGPGKRTTVASRITPKTEVLTKPVQSAGEKLLKERMRDELYEIIPEVEPKYYTLDFMSAADMIAEGAPRYIVSASIKKGTDKIGTVDDPRLGSVEPNIRCSTCMQTGQHCPGHYGIISLPIPIIHPNH